MAKKGKTTASKSATSAKKKSSAQPSWFQRRVRAVRWWFFRGLIWAVSIFIFAILIPVVINPPTTWTMYSEKQRLGQLDHEWVAIEEIAPVMARSAVAAEDANFCQHWGFDLAAIRAAIDAGGARGASTISQQVVKNVYLWQGRSWTRKAIEAAITPMVEIAWSKRRILEVYLNIAEFDEGVFGVEAAARHYFGVGPEDLSASQAARLAVMLPSPKRRDARNLPPALVQRASSIIDGAATIDADGRAACFQ